MLTTNCGLPRLLTLKQGLLVEFEFLAQFSPFLTITLSEVGQLGGQVGQSFCPLGQFALRDFNLLLGPFPLSLPGAIGNLVIAVAIIAIEIGPLDHLPKTPFLMVPALSK